jgi:hypothetical protein
VSDLPALQQALQTATLAQDKLAVQAVRARLSQTAYDQLKAWMLGVTPAPATREAVAFAHLDWEASQTRGGWTKTTDPWAQSRFGTRKAAWAWIEETWHKKARQESLHDYLDSGDAPALNRWCQNISLAPFEAHQGLRYLLNNLSTPTTQDRRSELLPVLAALDDPHDLLKLIHDDTVAIPDESAEAFFFHFAHTHTREQKPAWDQAIGRLMQHAIVGSNEVSFDRLLNASQALSSVRQHNIRFLWTRTLALAVQLDVPENAESERLLTTAGWLVQHGGVSVRETLSSHLLREWRRRVETDGLDHDSTRLILTHMDRLGQLSHGKDLKQVRRLLQDFGLLSVCPLTEAKWLAQERQSVANQEVPQARSRPRRRT